MYDQIQKLRTFFIGLASIMTDDQSGSVMNLTVDVSLDQDLSGTVMNDQDWSETVNQSL